MLIRGVFGGGAASGKVGNMVASHNKGGQYLRTRVTPTNPRSARQTAVRTALGTIASMWQTLTASARQAWNAYGAARGTTNRLGDVVPISGIAAYQRTNVPRVAAGYSRVDVAPPNVELSPPVGGMTMNFSYGATTGTLVLAGAGLPLDTSTNSFFTVATTPPFSLGRTAAPTQTRLATTIPGTATVGSYAFTLPFIVTGTGNQMEATVTYQSADGRQFGPFRLTGTH